MVFPSVSVYLDHPNWHQLQQPNHQEGRGIENHELPLPPPPPQLGGGGGSIRPGSMVDRARLAKLPLPEAGLKCPRCDSTNTKFCYFNNYNLTQPRHFCKTCRRYWTRGGALRNVPVGGGCRRNKRSKSSSSKSAANSERQTGHGSTSASPSNCSIEMTGNFPQSSPQFPLIAALQNLTQYGGGNIDSRIGGFQPEMVATGGNSQTDMDFHIGSSSSGNSNILSAGGADQWRLPFFAGFESSPGLFPYQNGGVEGPSSMVGDNQIRPMATSSGVTHIAPVKADQGLILPRQFLGVSENNRYWVGNTLAEFSGPNSSSTSHFL